MLAFLPLLGHGGGGSSVWRFWAQSQKVSYLFLIFQEKAKQIASICANPASDLPKVTQPNSGVSSSCPPWGPEETPDPRQDGRRGQGQDLAWAGPLERGSGCSSLQVRILGSSPRYVRGKLVPLECSVEKAEKRLA